MKPKPFLLVGIPLGENTTTARQIAYQNQLEQLSKQYETRFKDYNVIVYTEDCLKRIQFDILSVDGKTTKE